MKTKYGNATINNKGYYVINSRKEGNNGKLLHRLVFEDYHDCTLDDNDVIHHADFDKTNNHPSNLICMSRKAHTLLHFTDFKHSDESRKKISESHKGKSLTDETKKKISESLTGITRSEETKRKISKFNKGKTHSEETKIKMSKSHNTTGYFRVQKWKRKNYKQGFIWVYQYYEDSKKKYITSVDIEKLEEKVKAKGLEWRKIE